jgi:hypothetical protein
MPDLAAVSAIISSLKTATDIAKFLRESDLSLERAELKLKLADLVSSLADAKLQTVEVQEALAGRDQRIKQLEEAFQSKDALKRHGDAYYAVDANGALTGEPYCLRCWDVEHRKARLHYKAKDHFVKVCSVCGSELRGRSVPTITPVGRESEQQPDKNE